MAHKAFSAGDVLTASDVNTYLMNQAVIKCTSGTRPSSPSEGMVIAETDTNLIQVWDGSAWQVVTKYGAAPTIQSSTSSGTWTKPSGARSVWVRLVGGGGGGGGATGAGSGIAEAGGGGGGAYCESWLDASTLASTVAFTVGAGGTAGTNGTTDGGDGGDTTFGTMTAAGGGGGTAGGTASASTVAADGGAGGAATGGNLVNTQGSDGGVGRVLTGLGLFAGIGGASPLAGSAVTSSTAVNGTTGRSYGGGGAGATAGPTTRAGGAGAAGRFIVVTYFS